MGEVLMLRGRTKRACFGLWLALFVVSCSDDSSGDNNPRSDGGARPDANRDAGQDSSVVPNIDAAIDAGGAPGDASVTLDANGNKTLESCLERPGPPTPPTSTLPCELVPPGLSLKI